MALIQGIRFSDKTRLFKQFFVEVYVPYHIYHINGQHKLNIKYRGKSKGESVCRNSSHTITTEPLTLAICASTHTKKAQPILIWNNDFKTDDLFDNDVEHTNILRPDIKRSFTKDVFHNIVGTHCKSTLKQSVNEDVDSVQCDITGIGTQCYSDTIFLPYYKIKNKYITAHNYIQESAHTTGDIIDAKLERFGCRSAKVLYIFLTPTITLILPEFLNIIFGTLALILAPSVLSGKCVIDYHKLIYGKTHQEIIDHFTESNDLTMKIDNYNPKQSLEFEER
jgi:hypothetical protein